MKNNTRINVKILKSISILILTFTLFLIMLFVFEGKIREFAYKVNPNTANLVRVSIYAVEHHDMEMIRKYLPLAIESPDFDEVVNKEELYVTTNSLSNENLHSAEMTYYVFSVELALAFLQEESISEFSIMSSKLFGEQLFDSAKRWYLIESIIRYKNSGINYRFFLEKLDENTPQLIEVKLENEEAILLNIYNYSIKQETYYHFGDFDNYSKFNSEMIKLAIEYNKIKEGK